MYHTVCPLHIGGDTIDERLEPCVFPSHCLRPIRADLHTVLPFQISLFQVSVKDFEQLICSYKFAEMQILPQIIAINESDLCY